MASLSTTLKAEGIRGSLNLLTKIDPQIIYTGESARIYWNPEQQKAMQIWLENVTRPSGKPSDVSIDFAPVIIPLAFKKAMPAILGLLALGFIAGKVLK